MKKANEHNYKLVLLFDDRGTASPEELAKYPLPQEQKEALKNICEKACEEFGLFDEQQEMPVSVLSVAKYILEKQGTISTWQLQKLCYYSQAWHYTWTGNRLVEEDFQAWTNGPVCPKLFKAHRHAQKVSADDFSVYDTESLSADAKDSIDIVLEHYGKFTGEKLRDLSHSEAPWRDARNGLPESAKSNAIITLESMRQYYRKHRI